MKEATESQRLVAAWEKFRAGRQIAQGDPGLPVDLETLTQQIATMFGRYFDPEDVARRFALPPLLQHWLIHIADHWFANKDIPIWLLPASLVVARTIDNWEVVGDNDESPARPSLWLTIGGWSDRHDFMIECDSTSLSFGSVTDWNDTHPWWNAKAQPDRKWTDLVAFFERPEEAKEAEDEDLTPL